MNKMSLRTLNAWTTEPDVREAMKVAKAFFQLEVDAGTHTRDRLRETLPDGLRDEFDRMCTARFQSESYGLSLGDTFLAIVQQMFGLDPHCVELVREPWTCLYLSSIAFDGIVDGEACQDERARAVLAGILLQRAVSGFLLSSPDPKELSATIDASFDATSFHVTRPAADADLNRDNASRLAYVEVPVLALFQHSCRTPSPTDLRHLSAAMFALLILDDLTDVPDDLASGAPNPFLDRGTPRDATASVAFSQSVNSGQYQSVLASAISSVDAVLHGGPGDACTYFREIRRELNDLSVLSRRARRLQGLPDYDEVLDEIVRRSITIYSHS